jgi:hypothetical protein
MQMKSQIAQLMNTINLKDQLIGQQNLKLSQPQSNIPSHNNYGNSPTTNVNNINTGFPLSYPNNNQMVGNYINNLPQNNHSSNQMAIGNSYNMDLVNNNSFMHLKPPTNNNNNSDAYISPFLRSPML